MVKPNRYRLGENHNWYTDQLTGFDLVFDLVFATLLAQIERASRLRPMLASSLPFGICSNILPLVFVWLATVKPLNNLKQETLPFLLFPSCMLVTSAMGLMQNGVVQG